MKSNSCVYFVPLHPLFNKDEVPEFESFDKQDSQQLYSVLTLNHKENLDKIKHYIKTVYLFDEKDEGHIPVTITSNSIVKYIETSDLKRSIRSLNDKYFDLFDNNLIIFSNSIGISSKDILKAIDLLSIEDEAFLVGISNNKEVAITGFNSFNSELLNELDWDDLKYENLLYKICKYNIYLQVINGLMMITNLNDFKNLYHELSKKESHNYCSEAMHEKFTNLFIEYRDLLK